MCWTVKRSDVGRRTENSRTWPVLDVACTIILSDEPAEGVQPSIRDEIVETLKAVRERTAISMILVEQNVDFIKSLSDGIVLLQKGGR